MTVWPTGAPPLHHHRPPNRRRPRRRRPPSRTGGGGGAAGGVGGDNGNKRQRPSSSSVPRSVVALLAAAATAAAAAAPASTTADAGAAGRPSSLSAVAVAFAHRANLDVPVGPVATGAAAAPSWFGTSPLRPPSSAAGARGRIRRGGGRRRSVEFAGIGIDIGGGGSGTALSMALPGVRTDGALRSALFRGPGRPSSDASSCGGRGRGRGGVLGVIRSLGALAKLGTLGRRRCSSSGIGGYGGRGSARTALNMVLTTPESIIEEASTQNLLDDLIDESVRTSARRPVMMQFEPSSGWIWRRWKGTVFSETWPSVLRNMVLACCVSLVYNLAPGFKEKLSGFSILWGQLLSVTTFTLTFFLNVSYALWRKCYELSRRLQGRLNDLGMTMAAHAARKTPPSPTDSSVYTPQARQVLEIMGRYVRVFNLLTYASFTRSHRPILTPRGMRRLVERGLITAQEREVLVNTELPATQRHNAIIMWIIRVFLEGRQAGHIEGGAGFEQQFMEKCHVIRAQYGAIGDELQGRMPLAYAHIVQVLVDVILWMYPFMAFSTGMTPFLGVLGTGLLTTFYQGLFDLAKQFLDPYDNENYGKGEDPLCVDTLIAETNAGSVRWLSGFEEQPFSSQRLKEGELFDYILPLRGYTVAELEEMEMQEEAERLRKEQELEEKKEAERVKKEQEEVERILREQHEEMEKAKRLENATGTLEEEAAETRGVVDAEGLTTPPDFAGEAFEGGYPTAVEEEEPSIHTVFSLETGDPITFTEDVTTAEVDRGDGQKPLVEVDREPVGPIPALAEAEAGLQEVESILLNGHRKESDIGVGGNVTAEAPVVNGDSKESTNEQVNGDAVDASDTKVPALVGGQPGDSDTDMYQSVDFGSMFETLDWFDEVGEDGSELRLSQMLADEVWEEELEREQSKVEEKPLSLEEYTKQATEIMEAAEEELLETEEILNAPPGQDASIEAKKKRVQVEGLDGSSTRKRRMEGKKTPVASYDQTKLDGISQLWGAPPELLDMSPKVKPMKELRYEDYPFEGISSLWGRALGTPEVEVTPSDKAVKEVGFGGISQLWNDVAGDDNSEPRKKKPTVDDDVGEDGDWFDEVGPDGKEYRLSQMLADEVWEEEIEPELETPMTLEDYSKQAAAIADAAEDEFLETEAILNAPPNANAFEVSEDVDSVEAYVDEEIRKKKLDASTETIAIAKGVMEIAEEVMEEAEEQITEMRDSIDDGLDVLDMDVEANSTDIASNDGIEQPSSTDAYSLGEVASEAKLGVGGTSSSEGNSKERGSDDCLPPDVDIISR